MFGWAILQKLPDLGNVKSNAKSNDDGFHS
jgi:hypothetical protein